MMSLTCFTPCVQGNPGCAAAPSLCIFPVARYRTGSIPKVPRMGSGVGENLLTFTLKIQKVTSASGSEPRLRLEIGGVDARSITTGTELGFYVARKVAPGSWREPGARPRTSC